MKFPRHTRCPRWSEPAKAGGLLAGIAHRLILLSVLTFVAVSGSVAVEVFTESTSVAMAQPEPAAGAQLLRFNRDPAAPAFNPHGDTVQGRTPSSKGLALLFWLFSAMTIGGAIFVITRKNLIAAVMGMVGTFLGVAAVYMMLYANFLSVVQMLVYAGAIMVLFVFVIMILNKPEDEPVAKGNKVGKALGGIAIAYLALRLGTMLISVHPANGELSKMAPGQVTISEVTGKRSTDANGNITYLDKVDWGGTKAVGYDLFTDGLFPFEAISILLLIAVVGAVAIARPLKDDEDSAAGV
jgi:NADH-quinone oxidoreductase subunit J